MPEFVYAPIAVFLSKTKIGRKVILTEMEDQNINLVVALELNRWEKTKKINSVRSIYPKENTAEILRWIVEDDLLEWVHKEKALDWVGKQQSNSADVTQLIKDSANIIRNNY